MNSGKDAAAGARAFSLRKPPAAAAWPRALLRRLVCVRIPVVDWFVLGSVLGGYFRNKFGGGGGGALNSITVCACACAGACGVCACVCSATGRSIGCLVDCACGVCTCAGVCACVSSLLVRRACLVSTHSGLFNEQRSCELLNRVITPAAREVKREQVRGVYDLLSRAQHRVAGTACGATRRYSDSRKMSGCRWRMGRVWR